jgi:hypothetical protein
MGTTKGVATEERATLIFMIARIFQAFLAEREGFEPSVPLRVHMISNGPSATVVSRESEKTSPIGDPSGLENWGVQPGVGQSWGNEPGGSAARDPVEVALAKALTDASAAGRFDVVAQLAKELEARRLARLPNVVALDHGWRGKGDS